MNNFTISIVDTDSITISKPDSSEFSKEEINLLTEDLNSLFEPLIKWEYEFYIPKILVIKTKNYVLKYNEKKLTIKGSALIATLKEPALKEFIKKLINSFLEDRTDFVEIYNNYVHEIFNIKDIKRWASKKTITEKVLINERANEANVREAIEGTDYTEGDKIYTYFNEQGEVTLVERWKNDHSKDKLLNKLYETSETFDALIPPDTFLNYKLKRNKQKLNELLNPLAEQQQLVL